MINYGIVELCRFMIIIFFYNKSIHRPNKKCLCYYLHNPLDLGEAGQAAVGSQGVGRHHNTTIKLFQTNPFKSDSIVLI